MSSLNKPDTYGLDEDQTSQANIDRVGGIRRPAKWYNQEPPDVKYNPDDTTALKGRLTMDQMAEGAKAANVRIEARQDTLRSARLAASQKQQDMSTRPDATRVSPRKTRQP